MSAPTKKRQAALFLSLACPGAGQWYLGARARGIGWGLGVLVPLGVCIYYMAVVFSTFLGDYTSQQFDTMDAEAPRLLRLCVICIFWFAAFVSVHGFCALDAWQMGARLDKAEPS